jgi:protein-S-isoprenylcysteine O-methyltransferase Ste14
MRNPWMEIKSPAVESFLKSVAFSVLLGLVWGTLAVLQARALLQGFDAVEALWLAYNATLSLLFLIRVRPSVISMDLRHWAVALITSFAGFAFLRQGTAAPGLSVAADILVVAGLSLGLVTAIILGRSYDFLPAVRRVKTRYAYQIVRHPMYLSSIMIKFGYVMKNPSMYNALLFLIVVVLYDRRAAYEEAIMSHGPSYPEYLRRVRYRFVPGVY